jgi:hypothetical protein
MKRLLVLTSSFLAAALVVASAAFAQDDVVFKCESFPTQEGAQAFFETNNPQEDPFRLDEDDDGIACEALPSGDGGTMTPTPTFPASGVPGGGAAGLPPTGGVGGGGVAFLAAALLLGTGVLSAAILRRRS